MNRFRVKNKDTGEWSAWIDLPEVADFLTAFIPIADREWQLCEGGEMEFNGEKYILATERDWAYCQKEQDEVPYVRVFIDHGGAE